MSLEMESYNSQLLQWPKSGRHLLAQFDESTIIVYQAYSPEIAEFAIRQGSFGGAFSYTRMSWIKTNFLWMMYRSGWGTKENQEVTLGLRISREFFDRILGQAVASSWDRSVHSSSEEWSRAVASSSVRLQWDPDHHPSGAPQERRAIQLGLRDEVLRLFGQRELLEVIDLREFVATQKAILSSSGVSELMIPRERVYRPSTEIALRLGMDEAISGK